MFSPSDASNTINVKLFPTYPNPPEVHDYQVPVCVVELKKMMSLNWDLTVQKACGLEIEIRSSILK